MGNIIASMQKMFTQIDTTEPTPQLQVLTEAQVDLIKKTWEIPNAKPFDSGEKILYDYFERYPHNQEKFAAFKNVPLLSLKVSSHSSLPKIKFHDLHSSFINILFKTAYAEISILRSCEKRI